MRGLLRALAGDSSVVEAQAADRRESILLVANYDSNVGYAWWLMESFWVAIAERYSLTHRVILAYPSISELPLAIAAAPLVPVVADFRRRSATDLVFQLRFLRRERVRMVYLTDSNAVDLRYVFFRLAGVQLVIVHDHTPGERSEPRGLKRFFKAIVHRLPYAAADALIGATSFVTTRHQRVNCFPASRTFTAPNGLPARKASEPIDVHALFSIPASRRIVVMAGRAHRVKGIDTALRALARLVRLSHRTDVHLLICGSGPHLNDFRDLARTLGIDSFVTFAGRQSDVPLILLSCDIAVQASSAEVGYSLSTLEYMEAGLAVIVSDNPSVSAATEHRVTGLLFESGSAESLASAILELLDDSSLRDQLGRAARARVSEQFLLQHTHAALLSAVQSTMNSTRHRAP